MRAYIVGGLLPLKLAEAMMSSALEYIYDHFFALILQSAAVTGFAYWLFKFFAEKWMDSRFAKGLESYRHEQQKELEKLRFEINKLLDRNVILNRSEYDCLPKLWALLVDAYSNTVASTSAFQQYPDLNRTPPEGLAEYLKSSKIPEWRQKQIFESDDKTKEYIKEVDAEKLGAAHDSIYEYNAYCLKNEIFIHEDIRSDLRKLSELLNAALIERKMILFEGLPMRDADTVKNVREEGKAIMDSIQQEIRKRLWSA